ncbi:MAG: hypothetical protein EBV16_11845, partial [Betaproteobacteria bacterium]|nr:hypothetical protein [Betaproteobacteria bacterium]
VEVHQAAGGDRIRIAGGHRLESRLLGAKSLPDPFQLLGKGQHRRDPWRFQAKSCLEGGGGIIGIWLKCIHYQKRKNNEGF